MPAIGKWNVVVVLSQLARTADHLAARQLLQNQRRNQPITEQRDFFGFRIHRNLLSGQTLCPRSFRIHASALWGLSSGGDRVRYRDRYTGWSQKLRPA